MEISASENCGKVQLVLKITVVKVEAPPLEQWDPSGALSLW